MCVRAQANTEHTLHELGTKQSCVRTREPVTHAQLTRSGGLTIAKSLPERSQGVIRRVSTASARVDGRKRPWRDDPAHVARVPRLALPWDRRTSAEQLTESALRADTRAAIDSGLKALQPRWGHELVEI